MRIGKNKKSNLKNHLKKDVSDEKIFWIIEKFHSYGTKKNSLKINKFPVPKTFSGISDISSVKI